MSWFFRGGKNYLVLVFGSKLTCFCVEASKVTPFYSDDGIGLISIVASKLIDLCVRGHIFTWFKCLDRKCLAFCAGDRF